MAQYIYYSDVINNNIKKLTDAFCEKNLNFYHFYSVKTNPSQLVLNTIAKTDSSFEIVSNKEWNLIKNFKKKIIILNGPNKSLKLVKHILLQVNKLIFNVDNDSDLEILEKLPKHLRRKVFIGIRVYLPKNQNDWTRFGYNILSPKTEKIIKKINQTYKLNGIHFHSSTLAVESEKYINLIFEIAKIIKKLNLKLDYLDIGGGYVEPWDKKYQENMYTNIPEMISEKFPKLLIFGEHGRNIVSDSFDLKAKIATLKKVSNNRYIVNLDCNIYHFMCFFDHRYKVEYLSTLNGKTKNDFILDIYGNSCMQIDFIAPDFVIHTQPHINDTILIKNIGAYSLSMASDFITCKPKIMINKNL